VETDRTEREGKGKESQSLEKWMMK
jgi:hypothetical protein